MASESKAGPVTAMVVRGRGPLAGRNREREAQLQNLWFALARTPWRSTVVVPVDDDGSAAGIAAGLSSVGRGLHAGPTTFLVLTRPIDYASAERFVSAVASRAAPGENPSSAPKVVISVPPVAIEPLGLAVVGAADAVILSITQGVTRVADVERTLTLVGRDRVVGCVLG